MIFPSDGESDTGGKPGARIVVIGGEGLRIVLGGTRGEKAR